MRSVTRSVTAMFYDDHDHREILASGTYWPEDPGGIIDGRRSEPPMPERVEVDEMLSKDGGDAWADRLLDAAEEALMQEAHRQIEIENDI